MIGIYKITNKITNECYIGQSSNIEKRLKDHKWKAFTSNKEDKEYNKKLYVALREYGLDNFTFEVLEEVNLEELNSKEQEYIQLFNSFECGYNETLGGDGMQFGVNYGEKHPNAKLTECEVYYIREKYNEHYDFNELYKEFKNKIKLKGFKDIFYGYTWKNTHYDVYTDENKKYYMNKKQSRPLDKNPRTKLTNEEVYKIRLRKKCGEDRKEVYKDYKDKLTKGSFNNLWYYRNWKEIIV